MYFLRYPFNIILENSRELPSLDLIWKSISVGSLIPLVFAPLAGPTVRRDVGVAAPWWRGRDVTHHVECYSITCSPHVDSSCSVLVTATVYLCYWSPGCIFTFKLLNACNSPASTLTNSCDVIQILLTANVTTLKKLTRFFANILLTQISCGIPVQ